MSAKNINGRGAAELGIVVGAVLCGAGHLIVRLQQAAGNLQGAVTMLQSGMQFAAQMADNLWITPAAEPLEPVPPIKQVQEEKEALE